MIPGTLGHPGLFTHAPLILSIPPECSWEMVPLVGPALLLSVSSPRASSSAQGKQRPISHRPSACM